MLVSVAEVLSSHNVSDSEEVFQGCDICSNVMHAGNVDSMRHIRYLFQTTIS